jgi:hypothetical protein
MRKHKTAIEYVALMLFERAGEKVSNPDLLAAIAEIDFCDGDNDRWDWTE